MNEPTDETTRSFPPVAAFPPVTQPTEAEQAVSDLVDRYCCGELTEKQLEEQMPGLMAKALPSARYNLKTAQRIQQHSSQEEALLSERFWPYLAGAKHAVVPPLQKNDPEPFFQALRLWPALLLDVDIHRLTVAAWFSQKHLAGEEGKHARDWLKRIGQELAHAFPGRFELPAPERTARKKKSWRTASDDLRKRKRAGKRAS